MRRIRHALAYGASKAALAQAARSLGAELRAARLAARLALASPGMANTRLLVRGRRAVGVVNPDGYALANLKADPAERIDAARTRSDADMAIRTIKIMIRRRIRIRLSTVGSTYNRVSSCLRLEDSYHMSLVRHDRSRNQFTEVFCFFFLGKF